MRRKKKTKTSNLFKYSVVFYFAKIFNAKPVEDGTGRENVIIKKLNFLENFIILYLKVKTSGTYIHMTFFS